MATHILEPDIERLRSALVRQREVLRAARRGHDAEERGITNAEIEDADVAERMIEQESALQLAAFDAPLLADVEQALTKIEAGTYGISEESGEPIPLERLEAVPWARRTIQEEERRTRGSGR